MAFFTAELERNGYAAMYKQTKNKPREDRPWYQVYTIKDYRKMQNEVRLSRAPLGPDLDNETYKEKVSDDILLITGIRVRLIDDNIYSSVEGSQMSTDC